MTTKEQLNEIRACKIKIQNKQEEFRQLEDISVQMKQDGGVQTSYKGSTTERLAIEIAAAQQDIQTQQVKLIEKQRELTRLIEKVKDPALYDILHRRYIQCQTWKEIKEETVYSASHLYRMHKKALKVIETQKQ